MTSEKKRELSVMSQVKLLPLLLLLSANVIYGQGEVTRVGTTAANFLGMEVGTKAVAMGGAFTAMADDATATFWNPAGLTRANGPVTHYEIIDMYAGMDHQFAAVVVPMGNGNFIGFSVNYFSSGDMEITTIAEPEGTNSFFNAASYAISGVFSKRLTDRVSFGLTTKFISERIWREKAKGIAFDIGTTYRTVNDQLTIGMVLQNLGPTMSMNDGPDISLSIDDEIFPGLPDREVRFITEDFDLPVSFTLGFAYTLLGSQGALIENPSGKLVLITDISDGFDSQLRNKWGFDYTWQEFISLRGGYRINYDVATWSTGAGIVLPVSDGDFVLDYAWSSWGDLGSISMWSAEIRF